MNDELRKPEERIAWLERKALNAPSTCTINPFRNHHRLDTTTNRVTT